MFGYFEKLVHPYPDAEPAQPPRGFFAFVWACTQGLRPYIAGMTLLTAVIGAFEALLFSMLGRIVDWLGATAPSQLWAQERGTLLLLAGILLSSPLFIALQTFLKHQTLAGNMPMLLRWNFHRRMLGQSMSFYQDEFAGRVAAKVMQTALAARDVVMIICDIMVFVVIYFVTMVAVVGSFDLLLLLPFIGWLALYLVAVWYFVPRLGKGRHRAGRRALADDRPHHRLVHQHRHRQAVLARTPRGGGFARSAMQEFIATVHAQMRLVSGFEITNQALSMLLILATTGATLWLWMQGQVGVGAVAAATAMALRLNGISHWVMWEMSSLFEHIGTVQDGVNTLSRPHAVVDRPDAVPLKVSRGELRFDAVTFAYGSTDAAKPPVIDKLSLHVRAGEKIGLVGPLGRGQVDGGEPAAALSRRGTGARADRRAGHCRRHARLPARAGGHGHAGHLAAAPLRARQHPVRPARRRRCADDRCGHARRGARVRPGPGRPEGPHRL